MGGTVEQGYKLQRMVDLRGVGAPVLKMICY